MAIVDLRYARALESVVVAQKLDSAAVRQQLNDFATTFAGSQPLREVLENPSVPQAQKLRVIDAIAARIGMVKAARNFVAVLTEHARLTELATILEAFAALADDASGTTDAEIVSARPLDEGSRKLLEEQVAKLAGGQRVSATYTEDASLLGGAVVRIGSTVYDGSVRAQLQQLKQRLIAAHA
jgi:F-type H+-transporting ATPase subunit delta